jgi:hypothetical protein
MRRVLEPQRVGVCRATRLALVPAPVRHATQALVRQLPRELRDRRVVASERWPFAARHSPRSRREGDWSHPRTRRRPPKLSSRDKRALQERPAVGPAHRLGEEVGAEGVPPGPLPEFPVLAPGHPRSPPRTARSVTAGVASLVTTRYVRTTWTPSSGARMLTWRRA